MQKTSSLSTAHLLVDDIKTEVQFIEDEVGNTVNGIRSELLSIRQNINDLKSELSNITKLRKKSHRRQLKLRSEKRAYYNHSHNVINNIGLGLLPYQYYIPWLHLPHQMISLPNKNKFERAKKAKKSCLKKLAKFKREKNKYAKYYKKRLKFVFISSTKEEMVNFSLEFLQCKKMMHQGVCQIKVNVPNVIVTNCNSHCKDYSRQQRIERAINNFCTDNDEIIEKLSKISNHLDTVNETKEPTKNKIVSIKKHHQKTESSKPFPQSNHTIYTNVAYGQASSIIADSSTTTQDKGDNIQQYKLQHEDTRELNMTWSIKCQVSSEVISSGHYGGESLDTVNTVVILSPPTVYQDDDYSEYSNILPSNRNYLLDSEIRTDNTCSGIAEYLHIKDQQKSLINKTKYEFEKLARHGSDPILNNKNTVSAKDKKVSNFGKNIFNLRLTKSTSSLNNRRDKTERAFHKLVRTVLKSLFFHSTLTKNIKPCRGRKYSNQKHNQFKTDEDVYHDNDIIVLHVNDNKRTDPRHVFITKSSISQTELFTSPTNSLEDVSQITHMSKRTSSDSRQTLTVLQWKLNEMLHKDETSQLVKLIEQKYNHKKILQHSAKLTFQVLNMVFKFPTSFRSKELTLQICLLKELVNTHSSAIDIKYNKDVVACVDRCRSLNILISSSSVWQIKLQNRYMLQKIKEKLFHYRDIQHQSCNQNPEGNASVFLFVNSNLIKKI